MSIQVDVQYGPELTQDDAIPSLDQISTWAHAALAERREVAQLTVRIVGNEEGTALNETYRHKQGPTNVLSFAVEDADLLPVPLLGDIVICAPVVEREALEQHKEALAHWAHMVVHGVLHLLGYDHVDEQEAQAMETLEADIMARLGFSDPYQPS
ncbi:MAG: rRNA maturation RNase YbeY [Gammaproteobacteria bacterium]